MNRLCEPRFSCSRAWKSAMKCSGTSCTSTSKPTSPSTLKPAALGIERRARAELHGVRGDGEVGLADQARVVARAQRDGDALERGQPAGGAKCGLKPAHREHEARPVAEARAQRRRSGDRELVREARVDQHRIDRGGAGIEVDDAHRLQVQADEIVVGRRQQRADAARARAAAGAHPNSRISARSISTSVGVNQPILARSPSR